jgi:hypothetical protein
MTAYNQQQVRKQQGSFNEREELIKRNVHDYWSSHPFFRLSVKEFVDEFCGWSAIVELVKYASSELERAFLSALFLTGGRIMEVLNLRKENFTLHTRPKDGEQYLQVENMMLEKRYRKIGAKFIGEDGKNHFNTEKTFATRSKFVIMLKEPLANILLNWIDNCQGSLLFPSTYHHKGEKKGERCLSRHWAYQFVRFLDTIIPADLKAGLGLDKPFIVNRTQENPEGEQIADCLHLWLHWFRSQRASQLVQDYDFKIDKLMHYFSWTEVKTALRYLKTSAKSFADSMDTDSYE